MGQKLGKVKSNAVFEPFSNLPRRAISVLWQVFNDVADGFGIGIDELQEICAPLKEELNISAASMNEKTIAVFTLFDTDKNGLIDALEFLCTLAAVSGMKLSEIFHFALTSYDFEGSDSLSVDDVCLCLKTLAIGLVKTNAISAPKEELIDELVIVLFMKHSESGNSTDFKLRINDIAASLVDHPDVMSWYAYFGSPGSAIISTVNLSTEENDFGMENPLVLRDDVEKGIINWELTSKSIESTMDLSSEPWAKTSQSLEPAAFTNFDKDGKRPAPLESLEMEWVYGYQAERSKNNVRYNFQGHIVYHVSRYAVVYDLSSHEQRIFSGHSEEILCLAIHPNGRFVATGEAGGPVARLIVWDSLDRAVLFTDMTLCVNGVSHLSFSPDGAKLLAISNDRYQTLFVFSWKENKHIFSSRVHENKCLSCAITDNSFVASGDSFVYFWNKNTDGSFTKRRGVFSRLAPVQPVTCLAPIMSKSSASGYSSDKIVSGTLSGLLFLWTDTNCTRVVKGHKGAVNVVYCCPFAIISGGRDHRIRLWTHRLEPGVTFDCSDLGPCPSIRSLCMSSDGASILLSTKGSSVFEISASDGSDLRGGPIVQGSYAGCVHSIAMHPNKQEVAIVGDDQILRVYDTEARSIIRTCSFDRRTTCVRYSATGDAIAVGFGLPASLNDAQQQLQQQKVAGDDDDIKKSKSKVGGFVILNEETFAVIHEAHDSPSPVSLVAFSSDGETLAVATHEGAILLYAVMEEYELIGRCLRHTDPVLHLDFSTNGELLRTNSSSKDICFFSADDGSCQSNPANLRDVEWESIGCVYSWETAGLHKSGFMGESVTCVIAPSRAPAFVICGTTAGYLRLHSFPAVGASVEFHRFPAHVDVVQGLAYTPDKKYLLSIGRNDRCVIQWKCAPFEATIESSSDAIDTKAVLDGEVEDAGGNESEDFALETRDETLLAADFVAADFNSFDDGKVAAQAMNAWIGEVSAPSNPPVQNKSVPGLSVHLDYAYGYKCQDMRNCISYTKNDSIVYVCATLGVLLHRSVKSQTFFQKHTDAISAFACSKNRDVVATGQVGPNASIAVWDSETCDCLATIGKQAFTVKAVCFSENSVLLAAVTLDTFHTITVYNWRHNLAISRFYGGSSFILDLAFSNDDQSLYACGLKQLKMWRGVDASRAPASTRLVLGSTGVWQAFLCCRSFNGSVVVGTSDGSIYVFVDANMHNSIKAHRKAISAMDVAGDGTLLVTGGKDGVARIWDRSYTCIKELVVENLISNSSNTKIRCVAFDPFVSKVLIGTQGSEVFEVSLETGASLGGLLVQGHGRRELHGLACHPTKEEFVTAGDDGNVKVWNAMNYSLKRNIHLDAASRAVCYSPDGKFLVVGLGSGRRLRGKSASKEGFVYIYSCSDFKVVHECRDSREPIRVVKFSPDGKILAVGSDDTQLYIYVAADSFSRRSSVKAHKAPVSSIDFSVDGKYIMSTDVTRKMAYTEVTSGTLIPSSAAMRNERWATWSASIGWPVKGLWHCQPAGAEPCSANRSLNQMLIAVGNTCGKVYLSHYPAQAKGGFTSFFGHAGPVSRIGWLAGDSSLVTIGSKDHCVLQWKCLFDASGYDSGDEAGNSGTDSLAEKELGSDSCVTKKATAPSAVVANFLCSPVSFRGDEINESAPAIAPDLEFVHGFRSGDSRQAIKYNEDGHLVFVAVMYGVIFNRDERSQIFYSGHENSIISLDVDPLGRVAASGENAAGQQSPSIHLWDARTALSLVKFSGAHQRGVASLRFSSSSQYLVSLGQDELHSVMVFRSPTGRWIDGYSLASAAVSAKRMLWTTYLEGNEFPIVVGGSGSIHFFRSTGKGIERRSGVFGKKRKIQSLLCHEFGEQMPLQPAGVGEWSLVTGTVSGHLYIWHGQRVAKTVSAHSAPIYGITKILGGYFTACKDGLLKRWSQDFQPLLVVNTTTTLNPRPVSRCCVALQANIGRSKLAIGTRGGEIYEFVVETSSSVLLLESHSQLQLHGLDVNRINTDEFATVGDDGYVRVWSLSDKRVLRRLALESASRAVAFSPDGLRLVVGVGGDPKSMAKDGAFFVLDVASLDIILEDRRAKQTLTDIKYSPLGDVCAMASLDGKIYLHDTRDFTLLRSLPAPSKNISISLVDFSANGSVVRFATSYSDLYYFDVQTAENLAFDSDVRNLEWQSFSCPLTWNTQGAMRSMSESALVLSSSLHPNKTTLAVSYDDGAICLYRYPVISQSARCVRLTNVATKSARIAFSADGKYLLVLDSLTRAVVQYSVGFFLKLENNSTEVAII